MKKLFVNFVLIAVAATTLCAGMAQADNAAIKSAIAKYKAKNYVGCLQEITAILEEDPSDAAAYYYQALSFAQLGNVQEAQKAYNKVIDLNTNEVLVEHATRGIACLKGEDNAGCKEPEKPDTATELDKFINSDKFYSKSVQKEINLKKLERKKQAINEQLKSEASEPTDAEIAEAVRTLAKLGINPLGLNSQNNKIDPAAYTQMMQQSNELAQLNMLMGNNNNGQNNWLPMLLMSQNGQQKLSPELIQTMMMSSMNANFGFDSSQTY